jgi:hypothetical protein
MVHIYSKSQKLIVKKPVASKCWFLFKKDSPTNICNFKNFAKGSASEIPVLEKKGGKGQERRGGKGERGRKGMGGYGRRGSGGEGRGGEGRGRDREESTPTRNSWIRRW